MPCNSQVHNIGSQVIPVVYGLPPDVFAWELVFASPVVVVALGEQAKWVSTSVWCVVQGGIRVALRLYKDFRLFGFYDLGTPVFGVLLKVVAHQPCFHLPSEGMRCVPSAVQVSYISSMPRLCGSSQSMRKSVSSQKRTMKSSGQTRNESRDRKFAKKKRRIDVLVIGVLFITPLCLVRVKNTTSLFAKLSTMLSTAEQFGSPAFANQQQAF